MNDTGKGIDKKDIEIIFERFRQVGTETINDGTGLGLSITRGLVRLLGGKLSVKSTLNKGSTFYFSIQRK